MYIDYVIEDNYHRIKTIYQLHYSRMELSQRAWRKKSRRMPVNRRFMKKMRNNALGLLTGSSRKQYPILSCQWMANLTNRILCHLMMEFSITKVTVQIEFNAKIRDKLSKSRKYSYIQTVYPVFSILYTIHRLVWVSLSSIVVAPAVQNFADMIVHSFPTLDLSI